MIRIYTRTGPETEETVFVHITDDGYVKMTATNLDGLLRHLGYTTTVKEPTP